MDNKKCLIYETLNEVKTMNVKEDGDFMKLSGVFGVCGVRNNNHRIYEAKNYKAMIEEMKKRISAEGCPGELEHPATMNITLENISHKIDSIDIDENGVVTGEITLLNTPKGKIAQEIVRGGLPLFISSRAQGNVDKNGIVTLEMLKTYDLVGSPGFSQAKLHLNESQICESLSDNCFIVEEKESQAETETNIGENKQDNTNMDTENNVQELQSLKEEIEALKSTIGYLEEKLGQQVDVKKLADGIQNWCVNEFAPEIEKWIVEEYSPEIEKWVVEDYTPELANNIEKWIVEDYTPELANNIEKWIVEDYTPELANNIEKWVVEEYSPEVENWIVEEYSTGIQGWIEERRSESKESKLSNIDEMLSLLESQANTKPTFKRIVENNTEEPLYIAEMPEDARVKWNMANEQVKESIKRRAKIYNFNKDNAIQDFWEHVDWNLQITPITESVDNLDIRRQRLRAWVNR